MLNLLLETVNAIEQSGHTINNVVFIGSYDGEYSMTWDEFNKVADVEYDNGFGGQEVATDLIVKFSDSTYMTRKEYDGSEWWDFNKPLPEYSVGKPITRLVGGSWDSIQELNEEQSNDPR